MSLETLLEAARFVEQQELRAKQYQNLLQTQQNLNNNNIINNNHQINNRSPPFKIVSSVVTTPLTVTHAQLTQSPTATLVAVPQVPTLVQPSGHSLVAGASVQPNHVVQPPRQPGALHQVPNSPVMVSTQSGVVEVIQKPLPPTITVAPQQIQTITNGFDKATALLLEETHQHHQQQQHVAPNADLNKKRHQNGGGAAGMMRSGTREVHNKLEKNRRAHLKECFEMLKKQLPQQQDEKKTSNLSILHSALRYIQGLKKKERENEHEMERLARDKIASQQRLAALRKDLGPQWDNIDLTLIQPPEPPLIAITATNHNSVTPSPIMTIAPPQNPIKEELYDSDEPITRVTANIRTNGSTNSTTVISSNNGAANTTTTTLQAAAQLSAVPMLPLPQVGYPVSQGLVLGVQKVALVSSKNLPLVSSPIAHILPQLNGKVVPLVNAQYLMKPVVVVSTPNQGNTTITPRPS